MKTSHNYVAAAKFGFCCGIIALSSTFGFFLVFDFTYLYNDGSTIQRFDLPATYKAIKTDNVSKEIDFNRAFLMPIADFNAAFGSDTPTLLTDDRNLLVSKEKGGVVFYANIARNMPLDYIGSGVYFLKDLRPHLVVALAGSFLMSLIALVVAAFSLLALSDVFHGLSKMISRRIARPCWIGMA